MGRLLPENFMIAFAEMAVARYTGIDGAFQKIPGVIP